MTWNDVLVRVVDMLFKVVTLVAIPYLSGLMATKLKDDRARRLVKKAEEFVVQSVEMVKQTFVDDLKKNNGFDANSQKEAYRRCYENWIEMASDEMKAAVVDEVGDIEAWLKTKIESEVAKSKSA